MLRKTQKNGKKEKEKIYEYKEYLCIYPAVSVSRIDVTKLARRKLIPLIATN